jgi:hypothetical protein
MSKLYVKSEIKTVPRKKQFFPVPTFYVCGDCAFLLVLVFPGVDQ